MNVIVLSTADEVGEYGADLLDGLIAQQGDLRLGVATGSTPLPVYEAMARRCRDARYRGIEAWALDEYVGLPASHPESYRRVLQRDFADRIGLPHERVHVPDGSAADPDAAASDYQADLDAFGGVDLQILGIGANGHIGFNEPGSARDSVTRVVGLAERTRLDNRRFFAGELGRVPERAITQGVGSILSARRLLLLAFGENKAAAVAAALEGDVSARCPASYLQGHGDVTVVLDHAAASSLSRVGLAGASAVTA